jgi:uncharacterized membrane protein YqjE
VSSSYSGGSVPPDYSGSDYSGSDYAAGGATAANQPPDVEDQSVGSLVGRMTTHLSELMRQEIALAKVELQAEAQKAAKGAGMLAGAGFAAWMVAIFASFTLVWLLDKAMDLWLAALIVTLLWGVAAAALFVVGRKQLKQVNPKPEQTVESLKEDKEWLKAQKN